MRSLSIMNDVYKLVYSQPPALYLPRPPHQQSHSSSSLQISLLLRRQFFYPQTLAPPRRACFGHLVHPIHATSLDNDILLFRTQTNPFAFKLVCHNLKGVFGIFLCFVIIHALTAADEFGGQEIGFGDVGEVSGGVDVRGFFVAGGFVAGLVGGYVRWMIEGHVNGWRGRTKLESTASMLILTPLSKAKFDSLRPILYLPSEFLAMASFILLTGGVPAWMLMSQSWTSALD